MKSSKNLIINPGKILIHESGTSRKLYILRKGRVRVYKTYMGGKITLAILGPGEIFGELSFFDSKPRSASVEALTKLEVDCIDGEHLSQDIEGLPTWVHSVFKSVATRFRAIDQQMAVYQSLNNFQRKTLGTDVIGSTIYSDLLRITKILKMVLHENGNPQDREELTKELSQILGTTYITPKGYLRSLFEHDFFTLEAKEDFHEVEINEDELNKFELFLKEKFEQDTCTILDHYALGLMRKIISFLGEEEELGTVGHKQFSKEMLKIDSEDSENISALNQLKRLKILKDHQELITIDTRAIIDQFKYYSIIKAFDHTVIYDD